MLRDKDACFSVYEDKGYVAYEYFMNSCIPSSLHGYSAAQNMYMNSILMNPNPRPSPKTKHFIQLWNGCQDFVD
jgi:hypothetical protein